MKKITVLSGTRDFETFINRHDIEVINVDIRAIEPNAMFQEGFIAVVFYYQRTPDVVITTLPISENKADDDDHPF